MIEVVVVALLIPYSPFLLPERSYQPPDWTGIAAISKKLGAFSSCPVSDFVIGNFFVFHLGTVCLEQVCGEKLTFERQNAARSCLKRDFTLNRCIV